MEERQGCNRQITNLASLWEGRNLRPRACRRSVLVVLVVGALLLVSASSASAEVEGELNVKPTFEEVHSQLIAQAMAVSSLSQQMCCIEIPEDPNPCVAMEYESTMDGASDGQYNGGGYYSMFRDEISSRDSGVCGTGRAILSGVSKAAWLGHTPFYASSIVLRDTFTFNGNDVSVSGSLTGPGGTVSNDGKSIVFEVRADGPAFVVDHEYSNITARGFLTSVEHWACATFTWDVVGGTHNETTCAYDKNWI